CLQCQKFRHFVHECKAVMPTCARCAGGHSTVACNAPTNSMEVHCCTNCGLTGHGAAACSCSVFAHRLWVYYHHSMSAKYVGFPSNNPVTWK
ncbi:hypothetical protein BDQ17DRAFT_1167696, partial [Cyathus striatus]